MKCILSTEASIQMTQVEQIYSSHGISSQPTCSDSKPFYNYGYFQQNIPDYESLSAMMTENMASELSVFVFQAKRGFLSIKSWLHRRFLKWQGMVFSHTNG